MYLTWVSVRRVEDITEAIVGHASVAVDGDGPEQEDLRSDRDVAQRAIEGSISWLVGPEITIKA